MISIVVVAIVVLSSPLTGRTDASSQPTPLPTPAPIAAPTPSAPSTPSPTPSPGPTATPNSILPWGIAEPLNDLFQLAPLTRYRYNWFVRSGVGRAQYRLTLATLDRKSNTEYGIHIPLITNYPVNAPPTSGLGKIIVYAIHGIGGRDMSHSIGFELWLPTVANHVQSDDTQMRLLYGARWGAQHGSVTSGFTFAQSVIVPPGSRWNSFADEKLALAPHAAHGTFAVFYEGRSIFNQGGTYASAIGPNLITTIGPRAALNAYETWGIGNSGQTNLWHYKIQATASMRI